MNSPNFLSVKDFIRLTGLSLPTVSRRIKTREIPCTRFGRKILIPALYLKMLEEKAIASAKTEA